MTFIKTKLPCPSCGGSDPVGLNSNGSAWCFSCATYFPKYSTSEVQPDTVTDFKTYQKNQKLDDSKLEFSDEKPMFESTLKKKFNALIDRKISIDTAKKYGVKSTIVDQNIDKHYYPYYNGHELAAFKIRDKNKSFMWKGDAKQTGLFGENLFREGGKFITVVEGECDAMAGYELLGSKWPVVSLKNGAAGAEKDIKNSLQFLETFDSVVINFDNDKQGKEAAIKVARLLTPGKAKILRLPEEFKDANDVLRQGRHSIYVDSFWDSKVYTPSGIVNLSDQFEDYCKYLNKSIVSVPYPWKGLNYKLEGLRQGELVTLTGGTGLGKSSVTRELEYWLIKNTKDNIGIIALEESKFRTAEGLTSIEACAPLHKSSVKNTISQDRVKDLYKKVFMDDNNGRVYIHAHHGVTDLEEIFSKLRYMIIGLDCKWIVVDHLHMLVLSKLDNDERKSIDSIMHKLRTLVEETGCGMILVSHLKRLEGNRGHENGMETGLSHLRGSQSIAQLSDCVISLERNQQAEDPIEAATTKVRVLKSRYTGDVGVATRLFYCNNSGRLNEVDHQTLDELEL